MNCFQHLSGSRGATDKPPRGGATKKKADSTTPHALSASNTHAHHNQAHCTTALAHLPSLLTERATHAHPLHPSALAFVPYGIASGFLPRVHTLTLARAERVLSAMPDAEALLGWQKDSGLKSFVDDPDYNSAADDDFVDRGGPLESYNSKLSTLIELTKETKKLVQRMRTPPPWPGFVSEATKAANTSVALVNLAEKCMLYVTGRGPEPAAASESADARGGTRDADRLPAYGEGGGGASPLCGSLHGAFNAATGDWPEQHGAAAPDDSGGDGEWGSMASAGPLLPSGMP